MNFCMSTSRNAPPLLQQHGHFIDSFMSTGWCKKTGLLAILSHCMKIGGRLQYYMLNTVINFLFKNFIALWRHLAITQLLLFIHIVQIDLSITQ